MTELFTSYVNILLQKYNKAIKFHQETKTNNKDKQVTIDQISGKAIQKHLSDTKT